jgi:response regulator of citrate/malate metabolism
MIYTCGIVEDEPLAEKMLRKYIDRVSFLEVLWTCTYAKEAVDLMQQQPADILFLALQEVPIAANSSFLYLVKQYDQVIITSPYPLEAVGLELSPLAFLNKPIAFEHFLDAIERFLASLGS